MTTSSAQSMDLVLPFTLEDGAFRGRLVRMHKAADDTLSRQNLPNLVGELLGEGMALAAVVGSNLKFDGVITVQSASDGPVSRIVADMTSGGVIRANAAYDAERIDRLVNWPKPLELDLGHLMGCGHMALTVDQGEHTERYQGIVALKGRTLSDVAVAYFQQSEQIDTVMMLAATPPSDGFGWRASGIMLQRLPNDEAHLSAEEEADKWETVKVLLGSLTKQELLDPTLSAEALLLRLFHANTCRVYDGSDVQFGCRCSKERLEYVLRGLDETELDDAADDAGLIHISCDFCKTDYAFRRDQIKSLKSK
jgi:molecular chaperone Hsp33